ncbi:MAG: LysE family translocator [Pseudomonadota bacterium]
MGEAGSFLFGWAMFVFTAAAPGPSVFAIMGTSLAHGRASGLRFASGVCTGSVFWGILSAFGVGLILQTVGWALLVLKFAGAAYLLWMAWKAAKSAMATTPPRTSLPANGFYAAGLALHVTNPKAVFGWAATVAVGLPSGAGGSDIALFLIVCAGLAVVINLGYALLFSTAPLVRGYRAARRWIEGTFAAIFAAAGLGLLAWRP